MSISLKNDSAVLLLLDCSPSSCISVYTPQLEPKAPSCKTILKGYTLKNRFLKKSAGFILVTVMSYLLLMTILTLGVLETSLLLRKQANAQWQFWQISAIANAANQQVIKSVLQQKQLSCFSSYQTDNRYWSQSADKWGQRSCHTFDSSYRSDSMIELLPETLCLAEEGKETQFFEIYRISTQTQNAQHHILRIQSNIMRSNDKIKTCTHFMHGVSSGLTSWRMDFL